MALTPEEESKFRLMMASYDSGMTVSQMPSVTGLDGSELIEVVQNSTSQKATLNNILSLIDSYYVGSQATKTVLNSTNASVAVSDKNGNRIDTTYALKSEISGWVIGDIKLHYGTLSSIGSDWHVCDGGTYNGVKTPDMGGAYAIGYKESSPATPTTVTDTSENYGSIGNICGSNTHSLTANENGAHDHDTFKLGYHNKGGAGDGDTLVGTEPGVNNDKTGNSGLGAPHENRPNSVVLAFLMKIA